MHTPQPSYPKFIIFFFLLNLLLFNGCGSEPTGNQNAANTKLPNSNNNNSRASDNIEELLNIIRLPEIPAEVVWQEQTNSNPQKIIAVLKFEPEVLPKFLAVIEKNKQADTVDVGVENWFPEELTAQSQLSGEGMLKGTAYSATDFYNIPYGNGRIVRISGTDYFVLELTAAN